MITLIGNLREQYHDFLDRELENQGIKGIMFPHGSILTCLFRNGGSMQVLEIASLLDRSKSSISELIDRLVTFGYVVKTKGTDDRRAVSVTLTEAGWALKGPFSEISKRLLKTAYEGFSAGEQETFIELLGRMNDNFRNGK